MATRDYISPHEEAENCRIQALAYTGRREAPFLLSVARAFDELAAADGLADAKREGPRPIPSP